MAHLCDRVRDLQGPLENPLDYVIWGNFKLNTDFTDLQDWISV
ncbi:MAG: hypothetical protein CM1200mP34_1570 [Verrucomicrobiales bacterium]|nr:MAG: hypothetical protein CM1200mP34_1570 [Verrucomicrobiales bacterium]